MKVTLESLKKAVKKKKGRSMAFAWLADFQHASGDFDGALKNIENGLSIYPNDIPALLVRSKILFDKKDYAGCVRECLNVLNKDPFCLSAQKRLGDAYDKLGKTDDRNKSYRRVHDMDPLDDFWKEEYDVVSEEVPEVDVTPAASTSTGRFASPLPAEDDPFAALSKGIESADSIEDESLDALQETLNQALAQTDNTEDSVAEELSATNELSGSDLSSAFSNIFGDDDSETTRSNDSPFSRKAAESAPGENSVAAPAAMASDVPLEENSQGLGEAFGSIFGNDDLPEENSGDGLFQKSSEASSGSDEVFGAFGGGDEVAASAAETADKPQSVDDAFGSIFGDDDLPEEKPAETSGMFDKSASSDMSFSEPAPAAETPVADKPQSVDDAFGSIFGDDDLPEEKPAETSGMFDKSASSDMSFSEPAPATESPVADKPQSVDDAFGSIFGDDDLPEEKPVAEASTENSSFSDSAEAGFPFDEPAATPAASAPAEESGAVDNAFSSMFGDDDLPEEKPAESVGGMFDKSADESLSLGEPAASAPVADSVEETGAVDNAFSSMFGDDDLPEEKPAESVGGMFDKSADESLSLGEPAASAPVADSVEETGAVDNAFSSMFGDDDLPEEKPAESAGGMFDKSADESLSLGEPAASAPVADSVEETGAVDNAFSSMFGDDDLPEEKPAESVGGMFDKSADESLSFDEPATATASASESVEKSDVANEIGGAFASMFGGDDNSDSLDVPAEGNSSQESTGALFEESVNAQSAEAPSADLDSLNSEVSGAFKGLFDSEDDSLSEESAPNNSGVDFLMSGDSDDEVAASLIKDPEAPLDRGAVDLDDSLNTRTLADIYMEQGVYGKALEIYQDLLKREPDNAEIKSKYAQVQKLYREKFGENLNG